MRIRVLGSAAGGGVPQWNCACAICREARTGSGRVRPRTQDSLAVTVDGGRWALLNASPDVRAQIEAFPALQPAAGHGPRATPIEAIVLTSGDLDHCLGLFSLRESQPLVVYATRAVWRGLSRTNAIFRTLRRSAEQITWRELPLGAGVPLLDELTVTALPVPGTQPIHLRGVTPADPGDNVCLVVEDAAGRSILYAPGAASTETLETRAARVDCLLFDGTCWSSDELAPFLAVRVETLGHLPIEASLPRFPHARRRVYTHVNNTNPVLLEDSRERARVIAAGWEVATDGLEVVP